MEAKLAREPSETLLEPGCRAMPFGGAFWKFFGTLLRSISAKYADRARGSKIDPILVQNRGQKPPDGFESFPAAISVLISTPSF